MSTFLRQFDDYYGRKENSSEGLGETIAESTNNNDLRRTRSQIQECKEIPVRDLAAQQRENKLQLQQHERDQHIHQLHSISNSLLLDLPTSSPPQNSFSGSKFSQDDTSTTTKDLPANIKNMSISDLFGLGMSRGTLVDSGRKEQTNFDTFSYGNHQQLDSSNGCYPNSSVGEFNDSSNSFYLNTPNTEVPSSPISNYAPASPSTPGSVYSNPYSYSSVNSSPYTSASSVSNNYNKQFPPSPVRSMCYGRPIRGSPLYSDCSSPTVEFSPPVFGSNGSRSNSPADSENSTNSIDGPLSDIISYLSLNQGSRRCYPQNTNSWMDMEKYSQNIRTPAELQKIKKYLRNTHTQPSQQQQQSQAVMQHLQQYPPNVYPRNNYNNQQHNSLVYPSIGSDKNCCLTVSRNMPMNSLVKQNHPHVSLDKAVKYHRNAAAVSDAKYTWSGVLPHRTQKPVGYSSKVFLGGIPWDITESTLISTFKQFGQIKIEWPGKEQNCENRPKGYAYIIFESEKQVKHLLTSCIHDYSDGGAYYFKISSKRMKGKEVQVIPWALNDSNFVISSSQKLDPEKTVFVGALHGMVTAMGLAQVMNDLFDNVIYAGIDTDKHKYPIGSARVTFGSKHSFNKAINAAFVEIKTPKFSKIVQVDPYIEDTPCSCCYVQQGPYFCRDWACFKYFCHTCWYWIHSDESISWHEPLSRGLRNKAITAPNRLPRRA